jgi:hypothetical protein
MGPACRIRSVVVVALSCLALVAVAGCTGEEVVRGSAAVAQPTPLANRVMIITEPLYGDVVRQETVVVRGGAPAGALIVRDAQYAPDEQTVTDPDGMWAMPIKLRVGVNDLIFRVGDDPKTQLVLTLTFTPLAPLPTATPVPVSTPAADWIAAACAGVATITVLADRLPDLKSALGARDAGAVNAVIAEVEPTAQTLRADIANVDWPPATAFEGALSAAARSTLSAIDRARQAIDSGDTDAYRQAILDTGDAIGAVQGADAATRKLQADTGFACP